MNQVAWAEVETIKNSREYQEAEISLGKPLTMYEYCHQYFYSFKYKKEIIPNINGSHTSWNRIGNELEDHFQHVQTNQFLLKELYNNLQLNLSSNRFMAISLDTSGNINMNFKQNIRDFFGGELISKFNYVKLQQDILKKDHHNEARSKI